jgi:hypothetical protein
MAKVLYIQVPGQSIFFGSAELCLKLSVIRCVFVLCCALGLVDYQLYTDDLAKLMGVMPDLRSVFYTYDAHTS